MPNIVSNITNLDFNDIQAELKNYLKNQSEFTDFDFEGSGISALVDLLAYNTHMNAMMSHIVINESFLETAQVRSNVVAHAQPLGYVPASKKQSEALVDITITASGNVPAQVVIPQGVRFTGRINNKEYTFLTSTSYPALNNGDNTFTFSNVNIVEGNIKNERYNVDSSIQDQQFVVQSDNPDIDSLEVTVFDNTTSTTSKAYSKFSDTRLSGPNETTYFVKENKFGQYSISFGDGRIARKLDSGEVVELTYYDTVGAEANGIISFSLGSALTDIDQSLTNIAISWAEGYSFSTSGRDAETVESIRKNAPIYHATQDRAVTANDYRALVLNRFKELSDCSVWGGQDNIPPVYGKVFIAPALPTSEKLSSALKESVINFLRTKNIGSITPEIVDSEYSFMKLYIGVNYDTNKTDLSVGNIEALVRAYVTNYNITYLNRFNNVFRASNFLADVDALNEGIISSVIKTTLYKDFTPNPTKAEDYSIIFPTKFFIDSSSNNNIITSVFQVENVGMKIGDEVDPSDSSKRRLYFYNAITGVKVQAYSNIGYMSIQTGEIRINGVKFDLTNPIRIEVSPNSFDVAPIFNQLLFIKDDDVSVDLNFDEVSSLGSAGLSQFTTFTRT